MFDQVPLLTDLLGALLVLATVIAITFEKQVAIIITGRPQRSEEFQTGTGRDFAKSRDPGIFRDGINLFFSSRD